MSRVACTRSCGAVSRFSEVNVVKGMRHISQMMLIIGLQI